jgi:homoserine O-succinyltransferase
MTFSSLRTPATPRSAAKTLKTFRDPNPGESDDAGVYIVGSKDGRNLYITGHSEYDPLTLKGEYDRDVNKGLPIHVPKNYYPNDDPSQNAQRPLARTCQFIVFKLAELLRLSVHAV